MSELSGEAGGCGRSFEAVGRLMSVTGAEGILEGVEVSNDTFLALPERLLSDTLSSVGGAGESRLRSRSLLPSSILDRARSFWISPGLRAESSSLCSCSISAVDISAIRCLFSWSIRCISASSMPLVFDCKASVRGEVTEEVSLPALCCLKADILVARFLCTGNPEAFVLKLGAGGGLVEDDERSRISPTKSVDIGGGASSSRGLSRSPIPESKSKCTRSPLAIDMAGVVACRKWFGTREGEVPKRS